MNKLTAILIFVFSVSACSLRQPVTYNKDYDYSQIKRIAVLGFEAKEEAPESGSSYTGIFEKMLLRAGYQMVERHKIRKVMEEQNFQMSGAVDPRQVTEIGKILGVDAVVYGQVTVYEPHRNDVILVDIHSEERDPIISRETIETTDNEGNTTVKSYDVVKDYRVTNHVRQVPQVYRIHAESGVVAKMIDVETGEIIWVGSASDEAVNVHVASEFASRRILMSLKKIWPNRLEKDL